MQVTLMFPDVQVGALLEQIAHFAARRARTLRGHDALWREIQEASPEKRTHFLRYILAEEWSLDIAEMNIFIFDIEGVPSWLMTEFLRHRLWARDWSFEQRSKRAINAERIPVVADMGDEGGMGTVLVTELARHSHEVMARLRDMGYPAEKIRNACLESTETSFVGASNARALHHIFTLRGSKEIGANGNATPEFWALIDQMFQQAKAVCPSLFATLLRS